MKNVFHLTAIAAGVSILTGCTGLTQRVEDEHSSANDRATKLVKQVGVVDSVTRQAQPVVYDDGVWISRKAHKIERTETLPAIFNQPATFDRSINNIQEFAERITALTGYPVKVTPEAQTMAQRAVTPTYGQGVAGGAGATPGLPPVPTPMAGATGGLPGGSAYQQPIRITYMNGTVKGLLDTVASRYGIWWKLDGASIKFFYTETRTFTIRAVPGDSALNATVATGTSTGTAATSSGVGSTASTGQASSTNSTQTQMTSNLSVWNSLRDSVTAMLTANVGKVVVAPATTSLTVTDTPDVLVRVEEFLDRQNAMMGKQVLFNVSVLAVSQTDRDNYGISWDLIYSDLFRKYGIKNTFTGATGNTSLSAGVISPSSRWNGTNLLINALSQQGKVRLETTASVTALNNQPTPIQVAKQTTYVAQAATTTTANVGTTSTLTPATVSAGFSMTVLPSVMPDGSVILQFSTDISALRQIRQITSGGVTVEAPELDTRNFLQRVTMKSGESLIISGFEQTDDNLQNSGVGSPRNFLLGGGRDVKANKEVIVIVVTPVIVN